ncbi:LamG-like jellyroll fold domain-containing protein [Cerasicoccus frondis]|uniref:LamG-like jellyroll fold domain-containing protein n=1 Tax=Cerasicoccus frondis TaxID=490090 RepID=UPI0028524B7A|nr:LamG-like jellyroll fold domain-containing protein [Cerasicoccus frondis]
MRYFCCTLFCALGLLGSAYAQTAKDLDAGLRVVEGTAADTYNAQWWGIGSHAYVLEYSDDLSTWLFDDQVYVGQDAILTSADSVLIQNDDDKLFWKIRRSPTALTEPLFWDPDQDGVGAQEELDHGYSPVSFVNTDSDVFPDDWEMIRYGNLNDTGSGDYDGDHVSDFDEFSQGSNPGDFDQDTDGNIDFIYQDDLIAFWNFDERNGDTIIDKSGNGHDFTLIAGSEVGEQGYEAFLRHPLSQNQSSIQIANFSGTQFVDDFSISVWIRSYPGQYRNFTLSLSQVIFTETSFNFYLRSINYDDSTGQLMYYHANDATDPVVDVYQFELMDIANTLGDGRWHHLVLIVSSVSAAMDDGTVKFYLDGSLQQTISNLGKIDFTEASLQLNQASTYIDDIRIFDRVLSDEEISSLNFGLQHLPVRLDAVAPSTPANPSFSSLGTVASANWDAATDDVLLNGYILIRNNRPYQFLKGESMTDKVHGNFNYSLQSFDYDFNTSGSVELGVHNTNFPPTGSLKMGVRAFEEIGFDLDQLVLGDHHQLRVDYSEITDEDGAVTRVELYENGILKQSLSPVGFLNFVESGSPGNYSYYLKVYDEYGSSVQTNTITFDIVSTPDITIQDSDYPLESLLLSAEAMTSPLTSIKLDWPEDSRVANYMIYRKSLADEVWQPIQIITGTTTEYTDAGVNTGEIYEYRVRRIYAGYNEDTINKGANAYVSAAIEAPLIDSKGVVLLLIDETVEVSLRTEIDQLKEDLIGDGWSKVIEHTVERDVDAYTSTIDDTPDPLYSSRVQAVKNLIIAEHQNQPEGISSIILLGRVPIPYSGQTAWDGHGDHVGAWPADMYYGDVLQIEGDGAWEDVAESDSQTIRYARNRNLPGDGKFDNREAPSAIEIPVGRIDLADMSLFSSSETELLRNYLNKNHQFRHGVLAAREKGIIDMDESYSQGQFLIRDYAAPAFNNLSAMFGHQNVDASNRNNADYFGSTISALAGDSYLFGYGAGPGGPTSAGRLFSDRSAATPARCASNSTSTKNGYTCDFADYDPQIMFSVLFGSYFGDWSINNSLLRAPIAADSYGLCSLWASNGSFTNAWIFHRMGIGYNFGDCLLLSQNNRGLFGNAYAQVGQIPLALMGDPTLKPFVCDPIDGLSSLVTGNDIELSWNASTNPNLVGYHVYRDNNGTFERLTTAPLSTTIYNDIDLDAGSYQYMVRAIELRTTGSGSFFNASQGVFEDVTIN